MQGIAGPLPQLMLLLSDKPLENLLRDADEPTLVEPGQIDGHDCYRVQIKRPDGTATFWIDQQKHVLRRIGLPVDDLRQAISREQPVENLSLVAEFTGAQLNGKIDSAAFTFEVPQGAEIVKFFLPPHAAQLLNKGVPDFKFVDLEGKPVTPASLAGKVAVLDFWATWCEPCRQSLPNLEKVREKYKDNPKVAFYAVSVDEPDVKNEDLTKTFADLKVNVPILRDSEQSASLFKFTGIPTMFMIDGKGIVQDYETGGNPDLAEVLPEKIDKLLAGENIYEKPLKEYREKLQEYIRAMEMSNADEPAHEKPAIGEHGVQEPASSDQSATQPPAKAALPSEEHALPEVKPAPGASRGC